jgi:hypothetical protein
LKQVVRVLLIVSGVGFSTVEWCVMNTTGMTTNLFGGVGLLLILIAGGMGISRSFMAKDIGYFLLGTAVVLASLAVVTNLLGQAWQALLALALPWSYLTFRGWDFKLGPRRKLLILFFFVSANLLLLLLDHFYPTRGMHMPLVAVLSFFDALVFSLDVVAFYWIGRGAVRFAWRDVH